MFNPATGIMGGINWSDVVRAMFLMYCFVIGEEQLPQVQTAKLLFLGHCCVNFLQVSLNHFLQYAYDIDEIIEYWEKRVDSRPYWCVIICRVVCYLHLCSFHRYLYEKTPWFWVKHFINNTPHPTVELKSTLVSLMVG